MTLSLWVFTHVGFCEFLWVFVGFSVGFPVGFCGYSHRNPVGMGWEWILKFYSHGNPANLSLLVFK